VIAGTVNANHQPIIRLSARAGSGIDYDFEAMVDTGFNAWLTLPPALIQALGLQWKRRGRAILADGTEIFFDVFQAVILWDGQPRIVPVDSSDSLPLVGMALLDGYELNLLASPGGIVTIQRP
jgi:clan AA aspartic protease